MLCLRAANGCVLPSLAACPFIRPNAVNGNVEVVRLARSPDPRNRLQTGSFQRLNETIANAGVTNPFAVMGPVIMGTQSNLAGIFIIYRTT